MMNSFKIILILHNIRSIHNVGSLFRTSDGLGVSKVYLSGYTPYPEMENDERLPHLRSRMSKQINKTALGAEKSVKWERQENINDILDDLRGMGFLIAALEQTPNSTHLNQFKLTKNIALILGNEVEGLEKNLLDSVDINLEIPMYGRKESFNVSVAGSMALYHLKFNA